jgi:hypothetical protein
VREDTVHVRTTQEVEVGVRLDYVITNFYLSSASIDHHQHRIVFQLRHSSFSFRPRVGDQELARRDHTYSCLSRARKPSSLWVPERHTVPDILSHHSIIPSLSSLRLPPSRLPFRRNGPDGLLSPFRPYSIRDLEPFHPPPHCLRLRYIVPHINSNFTLRSSPTIYHTIRSHPQPP